MSEQSDDDGGFNPYAPTDGAVDPLVETPDDPTARIANSEPPDRPTFGRWMRNLPVVISRGGGLVATTWLTLLAGYVPAVSTVGAILYLLTPSRFASMSAGVFYLLAALPVLLFAVGGLALTVFGPMRPLRTVVFEGRDAVPSTERATWSVLERFWPNVLAAMAMTVGLGIAQFLGQAGLARLLRSIGTPELIDGGQFVGSLAIVFAFIYATSPLSYLVPATDLSLSEALGRAVDLATEHVVYLLSGNLLIVMAAVGTDVLAVKSLTWLGWKLPVELALPAGLLPGAVIAFFGYASLFLTIEETATVVDRRV